MSSPKRHFNPNEEHIWGPILLELARKRCTISTITGKFKCGYQTLAQNDSAMEYVRLGWAEHDEEVLDLILAQAKDETNRLINEKIDISTPKVEKKTTAVAPPSKEAKQPPKKSIKDLLKEHGGSQ